ncbi:MAG: ribosome maturation factor RimM [Candidatus Humimicrobiaceae bacterium]
MKKKNDLRLIGIIGKPHGIHGEVILSFVTDYPDSISAGTIFFTDENRHDFLEIETIRNVDLRIKNGAIAKFKGVADRNSAEDIKGFNLFREVENSPSLPEGEFWIDDLIGCTVYNNSENYIGTVTDVIQNLANDNILVEKDANSIEVAGIKEKEFFIPLIDDYIDHIDTSEKKIFLKKDPEYI